MTISMPVCQIALSTTDLVRSAHWYRRTFDWQSAGTKRDREGDVWAQVPGLPEAHFTVWWLVELPRFFQFELFEFHKPRMRLQSGTALASDIGYSSIGLHVFDLDAVLRRLAATGGIPLTAVMGSRGARRVCLRDPEGVLLELMEDGSRPAGNAGGPLATVRSVSLSVPDIGMAHRFWVEALGMKELDGNVLHSPEHGRLWGLEGAKRREFVVDAGECLVEVVQYLDPPPRHRPAGYLLSDQGILNVAVGTTSRNEFDAVFSRAQRAGFYPCHAPWTVPEVATVVYLQDGQGFTVELLCVEPTALARMGFPTTLAPSAVPV